MRNTFPRTVTGLLVVAMACSPGAADEAEAPPVESRFEPGQVWTYEHREGEEQSRVYVGRVERLADTATVVHIQIVRVAVASPFQPSGIQDIIPHAAIGEDALDASVRELKDEMISPVGFADAYRAWYQTVEAGEASYFTMSVAEIVDLVERAVN
jgi:hypothetical protein